MKPFLSQLTSIFSPSGPRNAFGAPCHRDAADASGLRKSGFVYPPSVQGDLFNYLKPEQQETLKPILRVIKRPYQVDLCTSLLDYLEGNGNQPMSNPMLDGLRQSIIEMCKIHPMR